MKKDKILIAIIILQVLFFVAWIGFNVYSLSDKKSKTILLKTIPVDPRDYISGNYFTLNYDFTNYRDIKQVNFNEKKKDIYLTLRQDGKYYNIDYITTEKPKDLANNQVFIKARKKWYSTIETNIDKYFINENTKEPDRNDKVEVIVKVNKNGYPIIDKLIINDKVIEGN